MTKKLFKQIGLSLATVSIITTSAPAILGVGDIVFDPTQTAKQVAEFAEEAKRWQQTLLNTTGIRDSVQFVKDLQQLQSIMDEWKIDLMDLNIDNPQSQIGAMAKQLFDKYNLYDDCNPTYYNDDQKRICKNRMVRSVQEMAAYQSYSTQLQTFSNKLKDLSVKLASAENQKDSQDIANAISMQMAQLNATKAQIDLMKSNNEALEKAEARQKEQIYNKNRLKRIDWSDAPTPSSL